MTEGANKKKYPIRRKLLTAFVWLLTRTLYRIRILGENRIPEKGGAGSAEADFEA